MAKRKLYVPKTTPMEHQVKALVAADSRPARPAPTDVFAYLCDMGTGKSKIILDEWGEVAINGGPQDLLIIAPAGSYKNWFEDKSANQRSEINVHIAPELRDRMVVAGWRSGGGTARKEQYKSFLAVRGRPRAFVVNVEALSQDGAARDMVREYMEQNFTYMAIDESTIIKNPGAKRTRAIIELGEEAAIKRIATGLLTPKSPLDAFSQFEFLDWRILGFRSFYAFRSKYAVMKKMDMGGPKPVNVVVAYKNIDDLHDKIAPYSYRILKEDCLDLDPKTYMTRDVEHTEEQAKHYKNLRENATSELAGGGFITTDSVLQLMIRLHQINLGYVIDEDGNCHDIPENRTAAIFEILEQHGGKAIIWTPFRHRIAKLQEHFTNEFGAKSIAMWHGGNIKTRAEDERRFLGDPDCKYMLATQGAGMRGNTWVNSNLTIYDSNNHNLEERQQSEDRNHRKGQLWPVTVFDMMVEGTVDIKFIESLRGKYQMSTQITGENYRDWI